MIHLATWFLIFIFYSFLGWLSEVIIGLIQRQRFVNRGFLIGPICPIYGTGALLLMFCLSGLQNPALIFIGSITLSAILEYSVSYIMERLFHVRWWDYSEKTFNLNGRICLESLLFFGIGGSIIVYATPHLITLIGAFPNNLVIFTALALLLCFLIDEALSLFLIKEFRVTVGIAQKDATIEISERVHEILMGKGKLSQRLLKAFPNQTPSPKKSRSTRSKIVKNHKKARSTSKESSSSASA